MERGERLGMPSMRGLCHPICYRSLWSLIVVWGRLPTFRVKDYSHNGHTDTNRLGAYRKNWSSAYLLVTMELAMKTHLVAVTAGTPGAQGASAVGGWGLPLHVSSIS